MTPDLASGGDTNMGIEAPIANTFGLGNFNQSDNDQGINTNNQQNQNQNQN